MWWKSGETGWKAKKWKTKKNTKNTKIFRGDQVTKQIHRPCLCFPEPPTVYFLFSLFLKNKRKNQINKRDQQTDDTGAAVAHQRLERSNIISLQCDQWTSNEAPDCSIVWPTRSTTLFCLPSVNTTDKLPHTVGWVLLLLDGPAAEMFHTSRRERETSLALPFLPRQIGEQQLAVKKM